MFTWVIEESKISAIDLERATDPLSPMQKILYALLSCLTISFIYLTILELTPPQRPLSEVIGTIKNFFAVKFIFFLAR